MTTLSSIHLENSMDRGAWQATVQGVTKTPTQLSIQAHMHIHTMISDTEHFSMSLLVIFISSVQKCLFESFTHFWIRLFGFFVEFYCSVTQSCPPLCESMDHSTPDLPVLHHLPELAQTHVHWVSDAIQPSHPLSFFSCLQAFPASGSFPVNQPFTSGGQSTGVLLRFRSSLYSFV